MLRASANLIKDLKKQKRTNPNLLFLDNPKIIRDALNAGHKPILALTLSEEKANFPYLDESKIYLTDKSVIEDLSDVKTPQGVCIILEYIQHVVDKPKTNFLVLDGLQDPGNVGTLIRTAKASGFEYVYLLDSVKETNMKMIRSTAGACFSLNLFSLSREEFVKKAKEWELNLIKTDMKGENIFDFEAHGIVGVVIGNEGNGVSMDISNICSQTVSIPMKLGIESLNAGVSGAIIMYQINKNQF